jgi:predicted nucleic acid-binding protein
MRFLLDTTLIVDHVHGYEPAMTLLHRLHEAGAELFTCDVVVCEALPDVERQGADVLAY